MFVNREEKKNGRGAGRVFSGLAMGGSFANVKDMSVAEIKATGATLSPNELGELSRYLRGLALRKNPAWREQVAAALNNPQWVSQVEMEQALVELEKTEK